MNTKELSPIETLRAATAKLPNDNFAAMCDRDLSIALSKWDAAMRGFRHALITLETEASAARERNESCEKIEALGETRIKFLHAVRQVTRVVEEQRKRGAGRKHRKVRK